MIAKRGGSDTDTSRDYDYTDWTKAAESAEEFLNASELVKPLIYRKCAEAESQLKANHDQRNRPRRPKPAPFQPVGLKIQKPPYYDSQTFTWCSPVFTHIFTSGL